MSDGNSECVNVATKIFLNLEGYALRAMDGSVVAWNRRADFIVFTEKSRRGVYDAVVAIRGAKFLLKDIVCGEDATVEVGGVEAL